MIVATDLTEMAAARAGYTAKRRTVAFVPTMGALHDGHRSLFSMARQFADVVVVSIFVNPLQFGPNEDYARYPRTIEADLADCAASGVDLVFSPTVADLYPPGRQVTISAGPMGTILEGASRPGHFDGVLTVVAKFFNIVQPEVAIFGKKDAQQLACLRRMVVDLNSPVRIIGAPTVREKDGLALSSRNRYLTPAERHSALALSRAIQAAHGQPTPATALSAAAELLAREPGVVVDYLRLVQPSTLADVPGDYAGDSLLLVAAQVGTTRLIDNVELTFERQSRPADTATSPVAAV